MFQRQRNWISDVLWRPKKVHSLEQLRYLEYVLTKNSVVNETNRGLLVETLRSIAEILIWGDQNDGRVFDFFLEKNMLLYFLKMMSQKSNQICIQLLQTLSILFENISNETSLYYLLSNNHVNSIIIHKFDFSDEEVLAYYISFVKTLSLKLNRQTIHFFFNEHKNDFPLYTEALKFFNHSESMVRIAVRTLTLNVYRVGDRRMLSFIRHKTADPYFWNLVWFIGNHAIELNNCALRKSDHLHCERLKDLVAEHLDHLHYVHDILCLQIQEINDILTEHLLNRLLTPLYIYSLIKRRPEMEQDDVPRINVVVALFLLSQTFLIMKHPPLVSSLMDIILNGDEMAPGDPEEDSPLPLRKDDSQTSSTASVRKFLEPELTLEESLVARGVNTEGYTFLGKTSVTLMRDRSVHVANSKFYLKEKAEHGSRASNSSSDHSARENRVAARRTAKMNGVTVPLMETPLGDTDDEVEEVTRQERAEERYWRVQRRTVRETASSLCEELEVESVVRRGEGFKPNRMFFEALQLGLDCTRSDEEALFVICLLYASLRNQGVDKRLMEAAGMSSKESDAPYSDELVAVLIRLLEQGCRSGSKVRAVTLEMCIVLMKELVFYDDEQQQQQRSYLKDEHLAFVQNVREASTLQLRYYYKEDDIFLDMFEDEYRQLKTKPLNMERLLMDAILLLPVTGTPLTGIEFSKRLPCGEVEHTRRAIRVFLLMRDLCLSLLEQSETSLPLSRVENSVNLEDVLDLNNSDLIACTLKTDEKSLRRFLVIDEAQFILVEPDTTKLGWGVVKFVARLQDVETMPDKEDSRSLFITIHQPSAGRSLTKVRARPILSAKFVFDDYIRCMSAKQRLQRRSTMLRQHKLRCIAELLELPAMAVPPSHYYSITPPAYINMGQTHDMSPHRSPAVATDLPSMPAATGETASVDSRRGGHPGGTGARTTSQAEALANVLEHRETPPNERADNSENAATVVSVEEACEAIELERKRTMSILSVEKATENNSASTSSSESGTLYHSGANLPTRTSTTVRTGASSFSAPATPRGDRHPPPVDPGEQENVNRLAAQNFMSEPAIFFTNDWNEPMPETNQRVVKKTKKNGNNKKGSQGGKSRQRKR